jgi:DNA-binding MarR family transcriptional regulator
MKKQKVQIEMENSIMYLLYARLLDKYWECDYHIPLTLKEHLEALYVQRQKLTRHMCYSQVTKHTGKRMKEQLIPPEKAGKYTERRVVVHLLDRGKAILGGINRTYKSIHR